MISYIRGELAEVSTDTIVVEASQVGYNIRIPSSVIPELPGIGDEVKVYTHFQVREDAMQLYGFLHRDDLEMFRMLILVNGIGPKAALSVLSELTADELQLAVLTGDEKTISRAPGLGKKTAQKIILELKDKLNLEDVLRQESGRTTEAALPQMNSDVVSETVEALTALGYSASESMRAVREVEGASSMEVEELLKAALARIM